MTNPPNESVSPQGIPAIELNPAVFNATPALIELVVFSDQNRLFKRPCKWLLPYSSDTKLTSPAIGTPIHNPADLFPQGPEQQQQKRDLLYTTQQAIAQRRSLKS